MAACNGVWHVAIMAWPWQWLCAHGKHHRLPLVVATIAIIINSLPLTVSNLGVAGNGASS